MNKLNSGTSIYCKTVFVYLFYHLLFTFIRPKLIFLNLVPTDFGFMTKLSTPRKAKSLHSDSGLVLK